MTGLRPDADENATAADQVASSRQRFSLQALVIWSTIVSASMAPTDVSVDRLRPRIHQLTVRRRHGFTLIEMVATTVLLAIMLVATVTILRSLLVDLKLSQSGESVNQQVLSLLSADIANSRYFQQRNGSIWFVGYGGRSAAQHAPQLTPALVGYAIRQTPAGPLLVRHQRNSDGSRSTEPVWLGIGAIRLASTYIDVPQVEFSPSLQQLASGGWNSAPAGLRRTSSRSAPSAVPEAELQAWSPLPPVLQLTLDTETVEGAARLSIVTGGAQ